MVSVWKLLGCMSLMGGVAALKGSVLSVHNPLGDISQPSLAIWLSDII